MFHRTTNRVSLHHTVMTKYGGIDSQSMLCASFDKTSTTKKRNTKSILSWDVTTLLIMALVIRALFLMSLTPWFTKVRSFELTPLIRKHSHSTSIFPLTVEFLNTHNVKTSMVLFSTMTDYFATTDETTRKSRTNDEILNGASQTTQLLLQTPPQNESSRQRGFEDAINTDTQFSSVPTKERTLYDILGAVPTATKEELKRQYIVMAKLTHPDALISSSQQQQHNNNNGIHSHQQVQFPDFTEVAAAYQILSNPVERKKYDRTLHSTQLIQVMVLLGDICICTTLTMAEITSAFVWVTLMIILQPIAVHVTTELFYLSIDDDSGSLSNQSTWEV